MNRTISLSDVFAMSLGAIGANKLRSFLTLVGIVLGVASIIGVMTAISVMQTQIEKEMTVLGTQTFQVQKWPNNAGRDAFLAGRIPRKRNASASSPVDGLFF